MAFKLHLDKYGFLALKKGESKAFRFISTKYAAIRNAACHAGKRIGGKFSTRVVHEKPKKIVVTREV